MILSLDKTAALRIPRDAVGTQNATCKYGGEGRGEGITESDDSGNE